MFKNRSPLYRCVVSIGALALGSATAFLITWYAFYLKTGIGELDLLVSESFQGSVKESVPVSNTFSGAESSDSTTTVTTVNRVVVLSVPITSVITPPLSVPNESSLAGGFYLETSRGNTAQSSGPVSLTTKTTSLSVASVAPTTHSTDTIKSVEPGTESTVTANTIGEFRNPTAENNPVFRIYQSLRAETTDKFIVDSVRAVNSMLVGSWDRAFIKYLDGNALPGLKFIPPNGPVEMRIGVYFSDYRWQEVGLPRAELILSLGSSSYNHERITVREAEYTYLDSENRSYRYPKKVF